MKVHLGGAGRSASGSKWTFPYLNDSDYIGEAALQVVSIDEHAKGKAGAFVTIYQLSDEPRT